MLIHRYICMTKSENERYQSNLQVHYYVELSLSSWFTEFGTVVKIVNYHLERSWRRFPFYLAQHSHTHIPRKAVSRPFPVCIGGFDPVPIILLQNGESGPRRIKGEALREPS